MGRDFSNGAQLRSNEIARDDDENWKVGLDSERWLELSRR